MKVVIAQTVALNGGDAAILFGLTRTLTEAFGDVEITVFDSQPAIAQRLYPHLRFRQLLYHQKRTCVGRAAIVCAAGLLRAGHPSLARAIVGPETSADLQTYAEADLVVWTGGTYLVEHYDLSSRFFELKLLRRVGAPLVLFTQSAGPFASAGNRSNIARLGQRASLILTRDARSLDHFVEAGVPRDRLQEAADGAFALDRPAFESRSGVIVSLRHWPYGASAADVERRYVDAHVRAITRLVEERDVEVTLLSTCQGVPEYWTNDADVAQRVLDGLPAPLRGRVRVDGGFHTPAELIAAYGAADLVIATRMHAAILALLGGACVLPIAYEFKTRELFASFGQEGIVQDLATIEPAAFAERVLTVFDQRAATRDVQQAGTDKLCASAAALADRFRAVELGR